MSTFLRTFITRCLWAVACLMAVTATQVNADDGDMTTKVSGVISKIDSRRISVTTSWGHMNIQSDALADARVGDEITVWINESNVVIDAYPKGAARPEHRWIRGKLTYTSSDQNAITLWTPKGKRDFLVKQNQSKFGTFAEGVPITVQLNDKGEVVDVHRQLELELALAAALTPSPVFGSNWRGSGGDQVRAGVCEDASGTT
jgi:hypothetical protein